MFYVGLDLSLRSSGCCIWNKQTDDWHCVSFAANLSQVGSFQVKENVHVTICPKVPDAKHKPVERYLHVVNNLMEALCTTIPQDHRDATYVVVEEYCAKSNQRRASTRLHESGGTIKCTLETNRFHNVEVVINNHWKASVVGKGTASKLDTVRWVAQNGPHVDFLKLFGYSPETLNVTNGAVHVPSPVQDLADASAIAVYSHDLHNNCIRKPPKKPKVVIAMSPEVAAELAARLAQKREAQRTSPWANTEPKKQTRKRGRQKKQDNFISE